MFRFVEIAASVLAWSAFVLLTLSGGVDLVLGDTGSGLVRIAVAGVILALVISR